ncbi:MAG: hypothetical protein AAF388_01945 [Bacteroidota bacterium]
MPGTEEAAAIDLLNDRVETEVVAEDFPELPETETVELPEPGEDLYGELEYELGNEEKPGLIEAIEEIDPSQGLEEEQIQGIGDLVEGSVEELKDLINNFLGERLRKRLNKTFPSPEKRKILNVIILLDQQGKIDVENPTAIETWAEKFKVELTDFLEIAVDYFRIKKSLQTKPYREWQRKGIREYSVQVARIYFKGKIDPAGMLFLFILVTIGSDLARIGMTLYADRKEEE